MKAKKAKRHRTVKTNGHRANGFRVPPENFDLRKASDRQLMVYGLPRRPTAATHPRLALLWEELTERRPRFVRPEWRPVERFRPSELRHQRSFFDTPPRDVNPFLAPWWGRIIDSGGIIADLAKFETSTNWCGAYVKRPILGIATDRPHIEPLRVVAGRWTVPAVSVPASAYTGSTPANGSYRCSVWVGIDGTAGSTDVLQAGTESIINVSGGKITGTTYRAWIEWFGLVSIPEPLAVSPGDVVSCTVCAPWLTQNGSAIIYNMTTNEVATYPIVPPPNTKLSGNVAEWIAEDPGKAGGGLYPLANFGQVVFTHCSAGTQNIALDLASANFIDLVDSAKNYRAISYYVSRSSLRCEFKR